MGSEGHLTQAYVKAHPTGGSRGEKPIAQALGDRAHGFFSFGNLVSKRAFRTENEPQVGRFRNSEQRGCSL